MVCENVARWLRVVPKDPLQKRKLGKSIGREAATKGESMNDGSSDNTTAINDSAEEHCELVGARHAFNIVLEMLGGKP